LSPRRLASLLVIDTRGAVDLTPYATIRRVAPGVRATLSGGALSSEPPLVGARALERAPGDASTLATRLRTELEAAVGRAMDGASRVAVFVGGDIEYQISLQPHPTTMANPVWTSRGKGSTKITDRLRSNDY